jgi:hypothetical protein
MDSALPWTTEYIFSRQFSTKKGPSCNSNSFEYTHRPFRAVKGIQWSQNEYQEEMQSKRLRT